MFDSKGEQRRMSAWIGGYRFQIRAYQRCDSAKTHSVTFHQYKGTPGWSAYWG